MSTPDYGWLLDAAGVDNKKLAHLSLILVAESIVLAQVIVPKNRTATLAHIAAIKYAMREITRRVDSNPPDTQSTGG